MQMTGDFGHDYESIMISHHKCAVDLSQMALSKAIDASELKEVAQKMIDVDKNEIADFAKWLYLNEVIFYKDTPETKLFIPRLRNCK